MPWIDRCLASIPEECSIVVVDNASKDETVSYIKDRFSTVTLLEQEENIGFGQANNLGMRWAIDQGATHVFLQNQDVYLQKGCLQTLLTTHGNHLDYGILSPVHLNGKGNLLDTGFARYVSVDKNPSFYSHFILKKELQAVYEVPFVNAAGWLLPVSLLQTVGGFDPIFFHYGEDDNYCQRVVYHGFKIGVVPTAFIQHDREERSKIKREYGSDAYFNKLERNFKVRYGNVNVDAIGNLTSLKQKRKNQYFQALLKGRFSHAAILKKETRLITTLITELEKSRAINEEKGAHYL